MTDTSDGTVRDTRSGLKTVRVTQSPISQFLTIVACGDVDALAGGLLAAKLGHPVKSLDGEGVRGVRQQAPHLHPPTGQAVLSRPVADAVAAGHARAPGRSAHEAPDAVAQVGSAAVVQRLVPLQS